MRTPKGFTLIELIVVLIIVGVLTSLALSAMFSWIERSRLAEITPAIKHVADKIDACVATKGSDIANVSNCVATNLNVSTPHFSDTSSGIQAIANGVTYFITYSRNNADIENQTIVISSSVQCPDWTLLASYLHGTVTLCGSYYLDGTTRRLVIGSGRYEGTL